MMISTHRGFTLIELLVVIAIIGLLSSVVLASLSTARTKGKATAVKAALTSIRSQLEINANGGGYGASTNYATGFGTNGACTASAFGVASVTPIKANLTSNLAAATDFVCSTNVSDASIPATRWAIAAVLPDGSGTVCYDSFGANKTWPSITTVGAISATQINNGVCLP